MGRVKSYQWGRPHILKPITRTGKTPYVILSKNRHMLQKSIHRLVEQSFISNQNNCKRINTYNSIRGIGYRLRMFIQSMFKFAE